MTEVIAPYRNGATVELEIDEETLMRGDEALATICYQQAGEKRALASAPFC